jgi:hypothetical protein
LCQGAPSASHVRPDPFALSLLGAVLATLTPCCSTRAAATILRIAGRLLASTVSFRSRQKASAAPGLRDASASEQWPSGPSRGLHSCGTSKGMNLPVDRWLNVFDRSPGKDRRGGTVTVSQPCGSPDFDSLSRSDAGHVPPPSLIRVGNSQATWMLRGGPIGSCHRLQSAGELRELATRARRFASWLAPLDPSRPRLLAYADELDGRAATLDAEGERPSGANTPNVA